ncbi:SUR7 protein [Rutstroemia sp. NJR-2017a BBW]|nr:SUR7 protein [Rutstroemia sp. NJR-2017a BBW]
MLCLFAGHKPGFMEDYDIVTLNTSDVGANLIPTSTSGIIPTTTSGIGGVISGLSSLLPRAPEPGLGDDIENALGALADDVTDAIAKELGIKEWYSLHLMDMCEGTYKPNATAKGAAKNVSRCSNQTAMYHFNINTIIGEELSVGPFHLNLSDISWPSSIQDGLDTLSTALDATFVIYCIGIASAGLAILTSLVAIFVLTSSGLFHFLNWALASLAFAAMLLASIIITVLQNKATGIINKYGNDIGVYAVRGKKFLVLTWVATGVMCLGAGVWVAVWWVGRREKKRVFTEKGGFGRGKMARESGSSEFERRV